MRSLFFVALLVVSLGCVSAPAAAQSAGNQPVETPTSTPPTSTEAPGPQPTAHSSDHAVNATDTTRIDRDTEIVTSEYLPSEDVARITLRSSAIQVITISDAGRFQEGGKIPVRTVAMENGETATLELPVTEQDGYVGVAISTENTPLYAEIVQRPSGGLDILRALSSLQAWIAGAAVAFVWMVIAGWNVIRGENGRPEVA